MSQSLKLSATIREKKGKNANRKLRATGVTPAVFYRPGGTSLALQVDEAALVKLYGAAGRTRVFELEIDEKGTKSTHSCLIWDAEYYPTQNRFQHIDFYGVDLEKELRIKIPLEFSGIAKGTKLGGKLEVYREHIYILSKPDTLPSKVVVDISGLDIGQGLRVADLAMPEGVRASYDTNFAVITVTMPGSDKEESGESI